MYTFSHFSKKLNREIVCRSQGSLIAVQINGPHDPYAATNFAVKGGGVSAGMHPDIIQFSIGSADSFRSACSNWVKNFIKYKPAAN